MNRPIKVDSKVSVLLEDFNDFKKSPEYEITFRPVIDASNEIAELQRLSEEINEPTYEIHSKSY